MRHLVKYPVTTEEVMAVLETMHQDNPPGTPPEAIRIGGINDLIRQQVIAFARDHMDDLLKEMAW